jgi:hypothetical protein
MDHSNGGGSAAATDQPAATSQDQTAASSLLPSETWVEVIPNGPTPQPPTPPSDAPVAPAASRVAALIERPAAPPDPPGPAPSSAVPAPSMVKPAHSAHPKPAKPLPATALTVLNRRDVPVVSVTVRVKAKTVEHARPLASHAKAVLKLPKLIGCRAKVTATYAGGEVSETGVVDLCRERLVRLTD